MPKVADLSTALSRAARAQGAPWHCIARAVVHHLRVLVETGCDRVEPAERERSQIGNLIAIIGFALTMLYAAVYLLALELRTAASINALCACVYLLNFPLMRNGRVFAARLLISVTFMANIALLVLQFGADSRFQIYLVLAGSVSVVLFDGHWPRVRAALMGTAVALDIAFELAAPQPWYVPSTHPLYLWLSATNVPAVMVVLGLIQSAYLRAIIVRERALHRLARTDVLTGLANRRDGVERAEVAFARARRRGVALAAVMIDVDHFKRINDGFGHAAGDEVLVAVGAALKDRLRREDVLARIGGEEFLAVIECAHSEDAIHLAEALRARIADIQYQRDGQVIRCTASFGVACLSPKDESLGMLLRRADHALYAAKAAGRDRVVMAAAP